MRFYLFRNYLIDASDLVLFSIHYVIAIVLPLDLSTIYFAHFSGC